MTENLTSLITPSVVPYLKSYLPIMIFFILAIGLSVVLLGVNYLRSTRHPDPEKLSPYECGFNAFGDTRHRFDVRFYLIAILFIIFDLEIAFLFPWAISLSKIGMFGFWSMMTRKEELCTGGS